ncbi:MAG: hypothetical protein EBY32_15170 [Proteobacteria bacterium]|nr:hypothetical protein [Pseudomonadota bacterium]
MSSYFRGAKPCPIPINKVRACARETTALTEHALHFGGTTAVSSYFRGAKPCPIPINKVRACARQTTALTEQRPPWRSVSRHQINAFISP